MTIQTNAVLREVLDERIRQDAKWGDQSGNSDFVWIAVLTEEVGEAAQAALKAHFENGVDHAEMRHLREELIQVAAVAVAHVEALDRRPGRPQSPQSSPAKLDDRSSTQVEHLDPQLTCIYGCTDPITCKSEHRGCVHCTKVRRDHANDQRALTEHY